MIGKIKSYSVAENRITLEFEKANGFVEVISDDIIRVFEDLDGINHVTDAITEDLRKCGEFKVNRLDDCIRIDTKKVIVKVYDDYRVDFFDTDEKLVCGDYRGERKFTDRISEEDKKLLEGEGHSAGEEENYKFILMKDMSNVKGIYGLGDKTGFLNKKGYMYEMWNTDNPAPQVDNFKALYKSIPFFIATTNSTPYGIFLDNSYHSYFDMGKECEDYYYISADDGNVDYYYIAGNSMMDIIASYTHITGRANVPQLFTLGYHQSRWSYSTADEVKVIARKMREYKIPCDTIHMDIDYMDNYKVFTFSDKRFPGIKDYIKELGSDGFKIVTIIDPGVKKETGYDVYDKGIENSYFAKNTDGTVYENEVWPGDSVFPDFGNQGVRKWWADNHKVLVEAGVRGVWNDMNEPASFRGPLPEDVVFRVGDRVTDHREMHNLYGHFMAKATYDGLLKYDKRRPFIITRACFAGTHRYSTGWTGDNHSIWTHLQMAIPQLCNLSMSGMAFIGTDVGGFGSDATPELMARWVQVGCFSPLFRNHSAKGTRYQEPWKFGDRILDIYRKFVELRYELIPYYYDLFYECEKNGKPVIRPLILNYPNDEQVENMNDEFMVGENILVAPVVNPGQTKKMVYLPQGKWYDYFTNKKYDGGQYIIVDSSLDTCPVFVKAGAFIPKYPVMQYIGEKEITQINISYYPGEPCEYIHYLDDGESMDYKDGKYNAYKLTGKEENVDITFMQKEYEKEYKKIIITNCDNGDVIEKEFN